MQTTDDYKFRLKNLTAKFDDCCKAFDVHKMNERAAELGMPHTQFQNTNGLDADGHYSSAHDVAIM